jgi:hypothetical protein
LVAVDPVRAVSRFDGLMNVVVARVHSFVLVRGGLSR